MALSLIEGTNQGGDRDKQRRLKVPAESPWEMQPAHSSHPPSSFHPCSCVGPKVRREMCCPVLGPPTWSCQGSMRDREPFRPSEPLGLSAQAGHCTFLPLPQ